MNGAASGKQSTKLSDGRLKRRETSCYDGSSDRDSQSKVLWSCHRI